MSEPFFRSCSLANHKKNAATTAHAISKINTRAAKAKEKEKGSLAQSALAGVSAAADAARQTKNKGIAAERERWAYARNNNMTPALHPKIKGGIYDEMDAFLCLHTHQEWNATDVERDFMRLLRTE